MKATDFEPSETYSERKKKVTLVVRGRSWDDSVETFTYGISEKEIPKSLTAVKKFTRDLQQVYYAEVVIEEHTTNSTTKRID